MTSFITKDDQKLIKQIFKDNTSKPFIVYDQTCYKLGRANGEPTKSSIRYEAYKTSNTPEEFKSSGGKLQDFIWDLERGFVTVNGKYLTRDETKTIRSIVRQANEARDSYEIERQADMKAKKEQREFIKSVVKEAKAADKKAAKEAKEAKMEAEKQAKTAEKQAAKEAKAAEKEAEKQAKAAEKQAAKEAKAAEKQAAKEAKAAEKEAAKQAKAAEKQAAKAAREADRQAEKNRIKTEREEAKASRKRYLSEVTNIVKEAKAADKQVAKRMKALDVLKECFDQDTGDVHPPMLKKVKKYYPIAHGCEYVQPN